MRHSKKRMPFPQGGLPAPLQSLVTVQPIPVRQSIGDAFGDIAPPALPSSPLSSLSSSSHDDHPPKIDLSSRDVRDPPRDLPRDPVAPRAPSSSTAGGHVSGGSANALPRSNSSAAAGVSVTGGITINDRESVRLSPSILLSHSSREISPTISSPSPMPQRGSRCSKTLPSRWS
jgi:hypothetical protein